MTTEDPDDMPFSPTATSPATATFAAKYSYILMNQSSVTAASQRYMSTVEAVTINVSMGAISNIIAQSAIAISALAALTTF